MTLVTRRGGYEAVMALILCVRFVRDVYKYGGYFPARVPTLAHFQTFKDNTMSYYNQGYGGYGYGQNQWGRQMSQCNPYNQQEWLLVQYTPPLNSI